MRRSSVNCDAYRTAVRKAIEAGTYKRPQLGTPREKPVCGLNAGPKRNGLKSVPFTREIKLGLKLESTRGPVDVLVIDSVDPPTEN